MERMWVRSGFEIHKNLHSETSKRYYDAIKEGKQTYYNNNITNSNQKQLFQLIDGLFHVKGPPILPTHDSPQDLTHRFSNFFANKVSIFRADLEKITPKSLSVLVPEHPPLFTLCLNQLHQML